MSQASHRDLEGGNDPATHGDQSQSPSTQLESSHGQSDLGDSSGPLFALYSKIAQEEDNKRTELSQRDADMIVVFTGLFSASVATLLSVSVQDLRPSSQDTSAFYLQGIYQVLADPNLPRPSIPSTGATPPPFYPPRYAIWVNSLWFLSLVISLTVAFMATFIQQYARRYIRVTQQPRCSPEKRARIRALFSNSEANGWAFFKEEDNSLLFFLHLSFILFIVGAAIFLYNINRTVFHAVIWWIGIFVFLYTTFTLAPLGSGELLFTPLSEALFDSYLSLSSTLFNLWSFITSIILRRRFSPEVIPEPDLVDTKWKDAEEATSKQSSELDTQVLEWTFDRLDGDDALETFLESIPGFFDSKLVDNNNIKERLTDQFWIKFSQALNGFLDRTFSYNSVSESIRSSRLVTCLDAARATLGSNEVSRILRDILNGRWREALQSIEVGDSLNRWGGEGSSSILRRVIVRIISCVRERDHRWIALVKDELGISDRALQGYVEHGDSVLLAIVNHINRQLIRTDFASWDSEILRSFSSFEVPNTLPELRHEFCSLWNEIVQEGRKRGAGSTPILMLKDIRHIYVALHQDTDCAPTAYSDVTVDDDNTLFEPLSYPLCSIIGHQSCSTSYVDKARNLDGACPLPEAESSPSCIPEGLICNSPRPASRKGKSLAATGDNADISATSNTTNPNPVSTLGDSPAPGGVEATSTSVVFGTPPVPIPMPALSDGAVLAKISSSMDTTVSRTDHIPYIQGTSSSSSSLSSPLTTAHLSVTRDQNPPIPMEVFQPLSQLMPSASDTVANIMQPRPQ